MLKLFKRMKYAILSKAAERKINKKYGCRISIRIREFEVLQEDGKVSTIVKTEITSYEKDCKKLIDGLLTKGR